VLATAQCIRPDFVIHYDTHTVVLEVDEEAHKNRTPEDEVDRFELMREIMEGRLVLIRYVPEHEGAIAKLLYVLRHASEYAAKMDDANLFIVYIGYTMARVAKLAMVYPM